MLKQQKDWQKSHMSRCLAFSGSKDCINNFNYVKSFRKFAAIFEMTAAIFEFFAFKIKQLSGGPTGRAADADESQRGAFPHTRLRCV